jgi:hypothetical protein
LIQEARKVSGQGFHCCVLELKILGSGVENGERSFSFVGREKASAKKACTGGDQRPTPNGYQGLVRVVGESRLAFAIAGVKAIFAVGVLMG